MECYTIWDIMGGLCGLLFFAFIAWVALKKPPFPDDDLHDGGIQP